MPRPAIPNSPVAEPVIALDHHVAEVDADPEHDAALGRHIGLPLGHALTGVRVIGARASAPPPVIIASVRFSEDCILRAETPYASPLLVRVSPDRRS